jgi:tellurite methyltransferase
MHRAITGYHTDAAGDWVAELGCGHGQHVRHRPPLFLRPWVTTPDGRAAMLGTELDCVRCDRLELPEGYVAYKRTPTFDEGSIPAGLRAHHATRPGVWAVIHVEHGRLRYRVEADGGREFALDPATPGVVAPEVLHRVEPDGTVRFFVEFWRKPAA